MVKREPLGKKDTIKIAAILGVIVIPLIISFYAVNRELPENETFWYGWTCDRIKAYTDTPDYDRMTDIVKKQFDADLEKCTSPDPVK